MPILYEELQGYPKEQRTWNKLTATRKLICEWDERYNLYNQEIGLDYPYDNTGGFSNSGAYCTGGSIEPLEAKGLGIGGIAAYEKALVTLEYNIPNPQTGVPIKEDGSGSGPTAKLSSDTFSSNTEFLTLNYADFVWGTGNVPLSPKEAPGKLVFSLTWTRTLENVFITPAGGLQPPLDSVILSNIGSVNDAILDTSATSGIIFDPETLLYVKPVINKQSATSAQVILSFIFRPDGWNKFYRAAIHQPDEIFFRNGSIFKPYLPRSFAGFSL